MRCLRARSIPALEHVPAKPLIKNYALPQCYTFNRKSIIVFKLIARVAGVVSQPLEGSR
jgi:hypothetical protein